jgi:hypothetical protein
MPTRKPLVIVTRKLPDVVETRMRELFNTRLNDDDHAMSQASSSPPSRKPKCWCRRSPTGSTRAC